MNPCWWWTRRGRICWTTTVSLNWSLIPISNYEWQYSFDFIFNDIDNAWPDCRAPGGLQHIRQEEGRRARWGRAHVGVLIVWSQPHSGIGTLPLWWHCVQLTQQQEDRFPWVHVIPNPKHARRPSSQARTQALIWSPGRLVADIPHRSTSCHVDVPHQGGSTSCLRWCRRGAPRRRTGLDIQHPRWGWRWAHQLRGVHKNDAR